MDGRQSLDDICHFMLGTLPHYLPTDGQRLLDTACGFLDFEIGRHIDKYFPIDDSFNPDVICEDLPLCKDGGHTCKLFQGGYFAESDMTMIPEAATSSNSSLQKLDPELVISVVDKFRNEFIPEIKNLAVQEGKQRQAHGRAKRWDFDISDRYEDGLPIEDLDGDGYSGDRWMTPRGSHWRGFDCDESIVRKGEEVYPGRSAEHNNWDKRSDSNCNGIYGSESGVLGKEYEEKFCKNSDARGIMMLGDSASAHFHIPQNYFRVDQWSSLEDAKNDKNFDENTFRFLVPLLIDEFDFPQLSWGTGWDDVKHYDIEFNSEGYNMPEMQSIYKYLLNHNKCNHQDYQNVAMNGRTQKSIFQHISGATRDRKHDKKQMVFLASIGNDICAKKLEDMYEPEDTYKWANRTLEYLND